MDCTKVLHVWGGQLQPPVMPVDLAMHLCLDQAQPLYQMMTVARLKSTKSLREAKDCLQRTALYSQQRLSTASSCSSSSSSPYSSLEPSDTPRSCFRRDGSSLNKKRVVFADAKGLALTAVRLFVPEPSPPASPLPPHHATAANPPAAGMSVRQPAQTMWPRYKLRLGFPQPVPDSQAFLSRLKETQVQLESCSVTERSLSGTVRVLNLGFEKQAALVRITFDSWRSRRDVACAALPPQRRGDGTDVFAFKAALPRNLDPNERMEFCVAFRPSPAAATRWDDNRGQNYRLCVEADDGAASRHDAGRHVAGSDPNVKSYGNMHWSGLPGVNWGSGGRTTSFSTKRDNELTVYDYFRPIPVG